MAGLAVAGVAAGTIGGGGGHTSASGSAPSAAAQRPVTKASHKPAAPRHKVAPAPHPSKPVTATPAAATTPPPVADTLEARGHQLMLNGDYSAAIPVLRQAVGAAPHGSLTYAYALYDLGRSLRLSGDPRDAVNVLYQRLQIPDQTETVRQELQLALQALGEAANQSGGANPGGASSGGATPRGAEDHGARGHHRRPHLAGPAPPGAAPPTAAPGAAAPPHTAFAVPLSQAD